MALALPPSYQQGALSGRKQPGRGRFWHLAGRQHIGDGFAAQVGGGDHVLLLGRVARGHGLSSRRGDALCHSDELFWRGGLVRGVLGLEHLDHVGGQRREGETLMNDGLLAACTS